jgi:hypothetical protein
MDRLLAQHQCFSLSFSQHHPLYHPLKLCLNCLYILNVRVVVMGVTWMEMEA